jgi:hypothetical protein
MRWLSGRSHRCHGGKWPAALPDPGLRDELLDEPTQRGAGRNPGFPRAINKLPFLSQLARVVVPTLCLDRPTAATHSLRGNVT